MQRNNTSTLAPNNHTNESAMYAGVMEEITNTVAKPEAAIIGL